MNVRECVAIKHLDFCSGIGGWAIAFRELGINTIAFCEIDKYPRQVLQKNFPNIPIFDDLKELTYEDIKERTGVDGIDILTCSYPCQPFSVAGKQKGEEDPRHLWPDTFRLVQECRPTWFVGENVSGHIKLGLDTVLQDLASEGYDTRTFIIPASSVGAWHKRERLWVIGYKAVSDTDNSRDRASRHKADQEQPQTDQGWQKQSQLEFGGHSENVSDTESLRLRGRSGQECRSPQWQFLQEEQEGREVWREVEGRSTPYGEDVPNTSSEGLQGLNAKPSINESQLGQSTDYDDATRTVSDTSSGRLEEHGYSKTEDAFQFTAQENWWQTQSELCGVPDGISYELDKSRVGRIKGLGNAIVPQIAWFIGHAIITAEKKS